VPPALLLFLGCGAPRDDAAAFVDGLKSGDCSSIADARLADECREATAKTPEDCEGVLDPTWRGECWFQIAESSKDASYCPKAAPFADDCALHVLSTGFATWLPKRPRPGEHEEEAARRISAAGLAADDLRPWSAFYRHVLGASRPIDRAACANVADATRRDVCERMGITMYHDLLNHARDFGGYPCDGGELPLALAYTPDPGLDAVRAARTDVCAGAWR
jgi:hypothetical protein